MYLADTFVFESCFECSEKALNILDFELLVTIFMRQANCPRSGADARIKAPQDQGRSRCADDFVHTTANA